MNNEKLQKDMDILSANLVLIRKTAKWSTQDLGDMVGLSKVTISNIENKKCPLTQIQYIAIRSVIDYEIKENKNEKLGKVMNFIYNTNGMSETDRQKALAFISGTSNMKMDDKTFNAGLAALIGTTVTVVGTAALWIAKVFKSKK